ncbi:MAG: hypothetical protein JSS83_03160 [Cyanobacteria bacterium SZAS LIN-3]|nr:hypothetical protein [Cyanobacteria bacterium SZAS LIN-3]
MRITRYQSQTRRLAAGLLSFSFALLAAPALAVPTEGDEVFNPAEHDHGMEQPLPLKTDPLAPTGTSQADIPAGPMTALPVSPEQVESMGLSSGDQPDTTKLSGQASSGGLMGVAKGMTVNPLTRYKGPRLVYIELTIRNNSDQPVVLLGEGIRGQCAGKTVYPVGYDKIVKLDQNVMTKKSKVMVGAAGVASLGLTSVIGYEYAAPEEYRKRNPGTAVGRDRGRHEIEEGRFNRRVVLPQDETTGWVAFYATDAGTLNALTVPLLMPPFTSSSGSVTLPIYGVNLALKAANEGAVPGKKSDVIYSIK